MQSIKRLVVPSSLNLVSALAFTASLANAGDADEFIFDFRSVGTVEPFAMLLVSGAIRRLGRRPSRPGIDCVNFRHMRYAAHMGFFQAFGLDYGNAPGEARGSSRYMPITIFETRQLEQLAATKGIELGNEVELNSKRMSEMLCGEDAGALFDTLAYSMREVMRNVVEHSGSEQFGICAQYWPSKERVEVAILDSGMGIRESLSRNPHIDASDHKKAINFALMPAVSGKAFKGSRTRNKGVWVNSGFGLYMTNRICRNGGNFFIASGDTGMLLTKSEGKRYHACDLVGTAVRMVISTSELENLRDSLDRFREEGYEFQRKYREIVNIDPSSASLMLSDDFNPSTMTSLWSRLKGKL